MDYQDYVPYGEGSPELDALEAQYIAKRVQMMSSKFRDLLPRLRETSKRASGNYTEYIGFVDGGVTRVSYSDTPHSLNTQYTDADIVLRNGIVMASRGLDTVTDVCTAMREDLARRRTEWGVR